MNAKEAPIVELHDVAELPENTNCLACSEDGRFLTLGHSQGLSVWCASSFTCVAEWHSHEITFIQMTRMAEMTYLLGTVDNMGVARLFALYSNDIHLLSDLNIMEDFTKRSICLTFDLTEGGHYGAAAVSCSGAMWLEIYQFPIEAWLKELEMELSQKQDGNIPGQIRVKSSPVTLLIKITPPKHPSESTTGGAFEVTDPADFLTHCLSLDVIKSSSHQSEKFSFSTDAVKTKKPHGISRSCTSHFLLSCGHFTGEGEANLQPAGLPVAVAVWWSGSHNLLQYLLERSPQNKPDVEPIPDWLWPNAKEIVCSAVSRCTRYVALGLDDALVCVWDRRYGTPLSFVSIPEENSTLSRMQFVENWLDSVHDSQIFAAELVRVFVLSKSGSIYTITTGQGTASCTTQLTERPKDSRDLPAVAISLPFLQAVSLMVQKNGEMFLQNVMNQTTVCFLAPPASHQITTPCSPVCALNTKQQTLLIRGDQNSSSSSQMVQSQLFVFCFGQTEITKQFVVSHLDSPQSQTSFCLDTVEELCNLYLHQRVLSVDERNKALTQTWEKLQETAAMIQQRQQGQSDQRK